MQKILIFTTVFMLIGCAYKIDIQQGNEINEALLSQLEIGMAPRQVIAIMGSPMLQDPFHENRWDYYYSMREGRKQATQYGATLHFEENRLQRIERFGDIPATDQHRPESESARRR